MQRRFAPCFEHAFDGRTAFMKAFLHIGAGKTGTSAIQFALERNRASLLASGMCYPSIDTERERRAAPGKALSGNCFELARFLMPQADGRPLDRDGASAWIARAVAQAGGRDLLLSSEALCQLRPGSTLLLIELLRAKGYEPVVIFYVRHLLDYCVAAWLQALKFGFSKFAAGTDRSMGSAVRRYRCHFERALEPYAAKLPKDAVVTRLYDAEINDLVPGFFRLLGHEMSETAPADSVVNRSPTPSECVVLEMLAAQPDGPRLCRAYGEVVLSATTASKEPLAVSLDDFAVFESRNAEIAARINERFLPPGQMLALTSGKILLGAVKAPTPEAVQSAYARALVAALTPPGQRRPKN
jgi:hypothetical protein